MDELRYWEDGPYEVDGALHRSGRHRLSDNDIAILLRERAVKSDSLFDAALMMQAAEIVEKWSLHRCDD